jgi:dihydroorotase
MNPPLREKSDVEARKEGLADGTIDAIATDHAPHNEDGKNVEFALAAFGTTGLETAFAAGNTYLVNTGVVTLSGLSRLMTARPAEILGLEGVGAIEKGAIADITVVDLNAKWTVDRNKAVSKSKNTLFHGRELKGRVVYTIVDGDVKFELTK